MPDSHTSKIARAAEEISKSEAGTGVIAGQLAYLGLSKAESMELVDFLNAAAERLFNSEHPAKMLPFSQRAYIIADQLAYEKGKAESLLFMAISHWFTSNLREGLERVLDSQRIFKALGDASGEMKARVIRGCIYRSAGDLDQSYLDSISAPEFFRETGNAFWESTSLLSLGHTCAQLNDHENAEAYYRQILDISVEPELEWVKGRAQDGIGTMYLNAGKTEDARAYFEQSLRTCRRSGNAMGEARALNDLGMALQQSGNLDEAQTHYSESLAIRREINQREAQCTCLFHLGRLCIESGELLQANSHFEEALEIASEVGAQARIAEAHKMLSRAFEAMGELESALRHERAFQKVNQEVANERSATRIRNLRTRLEVEQAEQLAQVEQQKRKKLGEQNEELERLLRELQTAQVQLVQSEKLAALGKLVAGITHEMNSPLGASTCSLDIAGRCIDGIRKRCPADASASTTGSTRLQKLLDTLASNHSVIQMANSRITHIVGSLKSFSNLDEADFQEVNVHDGIDSTLTLLESELAGRARVKRSYATLPPVKCFPAELNQVFLNLLTNSIEAIQQTDRQGEITIDSALEADWIRIRIADNGIGIPEERIPTLFDLQLAPGQTRVKAGTGLFVSHNIIEKHNGKIRVSSESGIGTTVTILIPMDAGDDTRSSDSNASRASVTETNDVQP